MSKPNLALYMRLSFEDDNVGESESISNQRDLLYLYLCKCGDFENVNILEFCDDGYSGKTFDRPAMNKLLEDVKLGKINCIAVKDFSRFGRNHLEAGKYLETIFPFYNVRFISVNDGFDSEKQLYGSGGLEIALKNLIHETYIRDISDKIRSVQKYKMQKGEYICSIAPFGYVKSKTEKNKLEVDSEAAKTVKYIFELAVDGNTPTRIAQILNAENILTPLMYRKKNGTHLTRGWTATGETNIWTNSAVKRILQDERFTGTMVGHRAESVDVLSKRTVQIPSSERIIVSNTHEAIVSYEIYRQAQKVIGSRKPGQKRNVPIPLFFQKIRCGRCGHVLRCIKNKKGSHYYCAQRKFTVPQSCTEQIDEETLKNTVLKMLNLFIAAKSDEFKKTETIVHRIQRSNLR